MKQNRKQKAWAAEQSRKYGAKMRKGLLFSILAIFFITTAAMAITGDASKEDLLKVGGVEAMIGMIIMTNFNEASADAKEPKQAAVKVYIVWHSQVDGSPPARVGRDVGTIPLKAGEYWHYIESEDAPMPSNSVSGDIGKLLGNKLEFIIGGMTDDVLNMLETGIGQKCYVVWEICSTGNKYLGGNKCKPMKLTNFEAGGDDYTGFKLTFENQCGELWSNYTGSITLEAASVVAADATEIPLVANAGYQLTTGAAAAAEITSFINTTAADVKRVVTVYGSGGAWPSTIPSGNDFLLIDGVTWEALAGTQISFMIFKDAGAGYKYMEVAGSRS